MPSHDPHSLRPRWVRAPRVERLTPSQRVGAMPYTVSVALSRPVTRAEAELLSEYGYVAAGQTLLIPDTTLHEVHANQSELIALLTDVEDRGARHARFPDALQDELDQLAAAVTFGRPEDSPITSLRTAEYEPWQLPELTHYERCGHRLGQCICEPDPPPTSPAAASHTAPTGPRPPRAGRRSPSSSAGGGSPSAASRD